MYMCMCTNTHYIQIFGTDMLNSGNQVQGQRSPRLSSHISCFSSSFNAHHALSDLRTGNSDSMHSRTLIAASGIRVPGPKMAEHPDSVRKS